MSDEVSPGLGPIAAARPGRPAGPAARPSRGGGDSGSLYLRLDPDHPTPLYHQIAQAVRWKIGTGRLAPGDPLPSLRQAEARWGVSYHTVRRAYRDLAREGFVASARGDGTRVLGPPRPDEVEEDAADLARFARRVADEATCRFGVTPGELAAVIGRIGGARTRPVDQVVLIECNDHQCRDLARQLEVRWGLRALPWNLARTGEPPPSPLVGTWFHYAEMRRRWPRRIDDMHFTSLRLDPAVVDRIVEAVAARDEPRLVLCERDIGTAREHAADLEAALPIEVGIVTDTELPDLARLGERADLLVVAPRLWGELPRRARERLDVVELRHVFDPGDLGTVGAALGFGPAS